MGKLEPISPVSPVHMDPDLDLVPARFSKEELIQNMDRVDREITMVEQQICKLRKKQVCTPTDLNFDIILACFVFRDCRLMLSQVLLLSSQILRWIYVSLWRRSVDASGFGIDLYFCLRFNLLIVIALDGCVGGSVYTRKSFAD